MGIFDFFKKRAAVTMLLTCAFVARGKILYVNGNLITNPVPDGLTWATAFTNIQAGVDAAGEGDEVWVAAATYFENITLKGGTQLYGGFNGTETELSRRNSTNNLTILDGRQANSVVVVQERATLATRIDGFRVQNGKANAGAGIYCVNASAVVANNTITSNFFGTASTAVGGGGIYCSNAVAVITNNLIIGNSARSGGGVYSVNSTATVTRNVISRNQAGTNPVLGFGGGVYSANSTTAASSNLLTLSYNLIIENVAESAGGVECNTGANATISNNVIAHNRAGSYGGGMECYASSPQISNNKFIGNACPGFGGGGAISIFTMGGNASPLVINNAILANTTRSGGNTAGGGVYCSFSTSPQIINNTLAGNMADRGGGIYSESPRATIANNLIAFGNSGIVALLSGTTNNCIYGNAAGDFTGVGTNGNFSADPYLSTNLRLGDVHLLPGSPCRDAGDSSLANTNWVDIDGQLRIQGTAVDVGADESDGTVFPYVPTTVYVAPTGDDRNDGSGWGSAKRTIQAGIELAAVDGGEVWVEAGTYPERIILRSLVWLYGGFQGSESNLQQRNWTANLAILDGGTSGSVVTASHLSSWCAIDGFTIQNGLARNGAGILCTNASPDITHNVIASNVVTNGNGGAIYLSGSSSVVANNRITGNKTTGLIGGGVYITTSFDSGPAIINNLFIGNAATNTLNGQGAALYCRSAARIVNNTLIGNLATTGAGICLVSPAPTVANNIVAFGQSGLSATTTGALLRNNCIFGNGASNYQNIPDQTGTHGNISLDPLLVNAAANDFHLRLDSPCINAGDNSAVQVSWVDLDGQPRVLAGRVDIGADEAMVAFLSRGKLDSGQFQLHVDGPRSANYLIQATSDFASWLPIGSNTVAPFDFIDPAATNLAHRFYRAFISP